MMMPQGCSRGRVTVLPLLRLSCGEMQQTMCWVGDYVLGSVLYLLHHHCLQTHKHTSHGYAQYDCTKSYT